MHNPIFYIWAVIFFFILHIAVTAFMCLHLKRQLKKADLEKCKKLLGINYQRRLQTNGLTKYKWRLGIMQVQGIFDETNKLKELEIKPYPFFTINYKEFLF